MFGIILFMVFLVTQTSNYFLQYFLNPKVAKEPVPPQLELIAKEILVPLLALFHHLVEKVVSFTLHCALLSLCALGTLLQGSLVSVWIGIIPTFAFCVFCFFFFFFFHAFCFRGQLSLFIPCSSTVHALFMGPTTTLFRKKILKMGPTALFTHLKIILL